MHVGLFYGYPTSLPCHINWHVEDLQHISCCFWKCHSTITSTISDSIASSQGFKACFIHSWGHLSRNSSLKIPELTTSWCSITRTVQTNPMLGHDCFPLRAVINWSRSSLRTPAVHYMVSQPPSASIWSCSHPIACCFMLLCCQVFLTVLKCASCVIISVAAIAASRWTIWCLRCSCVSAGGALHEAPVVRLDSDPIAPGCGTCGAMTCCWGKMRKMITKRSGKFWVIYRYLQGKIKWVTADLHVLFKLNPAVYSCNLQENSTVLRFAVSRSDVVWLFTGIYCSEWRLKSTVW